MMQPTLSLLGEIDGRVSTLSGEVQQIKSLVDPLSYDVQQIKSVLTKLETAVAEQTKSIKNSIERLSVSNAERETRYRILALSVAGLTARGVRLGLSSKTSDVTSESPRIEPFENYLSRLETLNPRLFPVWEKLFENGRKSYFEQRGASCSHREQPYSLLFEAYLDIYGHGQILDIGCGPHGLPSYLAARDTKMVSGIEPLETTGPVAFEIVRGFNEFLPWNDESFDTVVSGTSLDHVLSLEHSLAEVRRVLRPDGRYVVWLASVRGAPPFDPNASFQPIDDFHLFHFDREWIEPIFETFFNIVDITMIPQAGFDHVFYCMSPKT